MRRAESELSHRWRWGSESAADLLIVDPSSFAGQMARTRATAGGMRCALFSDAAVPGEDLVLRRPLKLANVVAVLNQTAGLAVQAKGIVSQQHDFYFREVGDDE